MTYKLALAAIGLVMITSAAQAQLVFGHTYFSAAAPGTSGAFYLDVSSGNAQQLWTGANVSGSGNRRVNGLAADNQNSIIYGNSGARLYMWQFGTMGSVPAFINGFYRLGTDNITYATGVDGLAVANSKVYAYTNFNAGSGSVVEDGIYEVDTTVTTATANMTLKWRHDDLAYNLQGIEYNDANGLFYAANLSDANAKGIYTIDVFGTGAITKIADFDPFVPTPDGLAVGGGHVWLTGNTSASGTLRIAGFNLATGLYDEAFELTGLGTSSYASGATWAPNALTPVPEPATMATLALGAIALLKRRKKV